MRKIQFFAFSAAAALALSMTTSCQKELEQAPVPSSETSTVCFTLSEPDTKTAMGTIGDKVTNVWSSDDNTRMTFYQNGTASTAVTITSDDNYKHASFTATFAEATADSYTYKALLAKNTVNGLPVVPAVQHPTASSFDPDANVLVGLETEFASKPEKVNLVYKHAAAISRISFTDIPEGLKIYGVQINASSAIAGAAKSVDYSDGIVDYSDASENTISLIYDSAPSYSEGKFDAYFVTISGSSVKITDIKLVTDKGTFVKTNSGSKTTTFDVSKFKTVKVAVPSTRTFYKASAVEAEQNYVIVSDRSTASQNPGIYALTINDGKVANTTVDGSNVKIESDSFVISESSSPSNLLWNVSAASNFTLRNGSYLININSDKISLDNTGAKFNYSDSELITSSSSTSYCLYYSTYSKVWKYSKIDDHDKVSLYTSKLPQTLEYSSSEVSYDIKNGFVGSAPVLTGASGSVTYTSSDLSVATVDAAGNVTVISTKDGDTATITATVEGNALYQSSSASYTLTVIDSSKKYYRKVSITDTSDLTSGQYLLLYSSSSFSSTSYYLFDANTSSAYSKKIDDPTDSKIAQSTDLDKLLVSFEAASSGKYYVKTSAGYLGRGSGTSTSINFTKDKSTAFTISLSNNQISMTTGDYKLRYSSSKFSYSSSSSAVKFDLYLLDGSKKLSRNLAFAESAVQKNIDDVAFTIAVTGTLDGTTVSYTSSNESVATVDENGQVTIKGVGTTTITASTAEDDIYSAASASYTLKVIDPSKITKYQKVDAFTENGVYLIVCRDDNYAMSSIEVSSQINVEPYNGEIASDDLADYEFNIVNSNGKYTFQSVANEKYLNYSTSGVYYVFDSNTTANKVQFELESSPKDNTSTDEKYFYFHSTYSGKTAEYLYYDYSASPASFKVGGSGAKGKKKSERLSGGVNLYKKVTE